MLRSRLAVLAPVTIATALSVSVGSAGVDRWPSFRGPSASGVAERPEPAGHVERRDRCEHPLEGHGSRSRALEPDRLGRSHLRDDARSAAGRMRRSSPASTVRAPPRRIARRSDGS